jgi:hypothetical protein
MDFPAIRKFECCRRVVLERTSLHEKRRDRRTLFQSSATVRDPGWSSGSVSIKAQVNVRTNSRAVVRDLGLVWQPYLIDESLRALGFERLPRAGCLAPNYSKENTPTLVPTAAKAKPRRPSYIAGHTVLYQTLTLYVGSGLNDRCCQFAVIMTRVKRTGLD